MKALSHDDDNSLQSISRAAAGAGGGVSAQHTFGLFIQQHDDQQKQSSYDAWLLRKKIDLRVLLPFVVVTFGVMPMVIQVRTLQGFHGRGFQFVVGLILIQSVLLLCITALELVMDRLVCVHVPRDRLEWLRGVLMVVYLVSSPVGHGGILFLRSVAPLCPSDVGILDLNFCKNGVDAIILSDNYMCLIVYAFLYQVGVRVRVCV